MVRPQLAWAPLPSDVPLSAWRLAGWQGRIIRLNSPGCDAITLPHARELISPDKCQEPAWHLNALRLSEWVQHTQSLWQSGENYCPPAPCHHPTGDPGSSWTPSAGDNMCHLDILSGLSCWTKRKWAFLVWAPTKSLHGKPSSLSLCLRHANDPFELWVSMTDDFASGAFVWRRRPQCSGNCLVSASFSLRHDCQDYLFWKVVISLPLDFLGMG